MLRIDRTRPADHGASTVEYGIVIASIAALILAGVVAVGRQASAGVGEAGATLGAPSGQLDAMAAATTGQPFVAPAADTSGDQGTSGGTSTGGSAESGASTSDGGTSTGGSVESGAQTASGGMADGRTSQSSTPDTPPGAQAPTAGAVRLQTLESADWSVLSGSALLNGTTVETTRAANVTWQNTSVMNTTPWTSPDITLTSTMRLVLPPNVTGFGYGLWLRATPNTSARTVPSGYSFQVDPGAGNRFVLKLWDSNGETMLAMANFPAGFNPLVDNEVSVSLMGDTFVAVVNGTEALRVNSLAALAGARGQTLDKTLILPTGTQFGLRAWQKADAVMSGTTVGDPSA